MPIEVISKNLGHADVRTTMQYIGVNLDHMEDALRDYNPTRLALGIERQEKEDE